jgi:hypothetical protein
MFCDQLRRELGTPDIANDELRPLRHATRFCDEIDLTRMAAANMKRGR